jgi:hypothetical protein
MGGFEATQPQLLFGTQNRKPWLIYRGVMFLCQEPCFLSTCIPKRLAPRPPILSSRQPASSRSSCENRLTLLCVSVGEREDGVGRSCVAHEESGLGG